jgi:hypothetical protein
VPDLSGAAPLDWDLPRPRACLWRDAERMGDARSRQCLAELLVSAHHFNFSTNIVATLIPLMVSELPNGQRPAPGG